MLLVISWQSVWPWRKGCCSCILTQPHVANKACLQTSSPHHCSLTNIPSPSLHLFETETDGWGTGKCLGYLQLCELSFGWGQEKSNAGDKSGAAGREHTSEPDSPLTVTHREGSTASLDLEMPGSLRALNCITEQNWVHDLPTKETPLTLLLLSKLWQESPKIPSPHLKKLPSS